VPTLRTFNELDTPQNQVLFVDFPIVQADVLLVSKGTPAFSRDEHLYRDWYNEYFGYGLSSIVFQEIREAKALAYSTYAMYSSPARSNRAHYLRAYVGTQPDKLSDALPALLSIIEDMPVAEAQMEHARHSILKRIASERTLPSMLYWTARAWQDIGISTDFRREIYDHLQTCSIQDLQAFQQQYVKGRAFTFLVLGSRDRVDMDYLASFGPVKELGMEEIFGY
ncbi:MAG TPA: insulinase family protein, partial [Saprospiraceae bacterium]|nr:insulinase family protein [Saprospiraceae bacterium]